MPANTPASAGSRHGRLSLRSAVDRARGGVSPATTQQRERGDDLRLGLDARIEIDLTESQSTAQAIRPRLRAMLPDVERRKVHGAIAPDISEMDRRLFS